MNIFSKQLYLQKPYTNEDQFCANTNIYISQNYPLLNGLYFHIANERVNKFESAKAKAMGVLPGVPDFRFEQVKLSGYTGLPHTKEFIEAWYLELKMPNGILSPAQKKLHTLWENNGIQIEVCYSPEQVCLNLSLFYGSPKCLKFEA